MSPLTTRERVIILTLCTLAAHYLIFVGPSDATIAGG